MSALLKPAFRTAAPNDADREMARESSRRLAPYLGTRADVVPEGRAGAEPITLPPSVLELLFTILNEMAEGNAVTLIPIHAELTAEQAAEILNVTPPYVNALMDSGELPGRAGAQRRVPFRDVLEYKQKADARQARLLDELAAEAQELGMGY